MSDEQNQEQGYIGKKVDETPNEDYTVAGVLPDMPEPDWVGKPPERFLRRRQEQEDDSE